MLRTRVTQLFGIEHPILMGAMGNLGRAGLVAAVSNAGGLGILASIHFNSGKELREEIRKTKSLTRKPFGVNITMLPAARPIPNDEFCQAIVDEGVPVCETAGRAPEQWMGPLKAAGVKVIHKAGTVRHAATAERLGCAAVYCLGFEAAGHPLADDVTLLNLLPRMVDTVKIPVVAAGGIADARQIVAAIALGAEGVMMATRFMMSKECIAHENVKQRLLQAQENDTVMIQRTIKNQSRALRNQAAEKCLELESRGATLEELIKVIGGEGSRRAVLEGNVETGIITAAQGIGLIHDLPTCKEIIDRLVRETEALLKQVGTRWVTTGAAPR